MARHSKGNALGAKIFRNRHRLLGKGKFKVLPNLGALADLLFGSVRSPATSLVLSQLRERFGNEWRQGVHANMDRPDWEGSIELAHLVDGYRVIDQLGEVSPDHWLTIRSTEPHGEGRRNDLGDVWTTLFLEHRRWRFASPFEPTGEDSDGLTDWCLRCML